MFMPQMSPMDWLSLMVVFMMFYLFLMLMFFYMVFYKVEFYTEVIFKKKIILWY